MTKSNKCSINPEGIDTLEGAKDPRTGQPPCGRQKRVGKAPAMPVPFPLFWIRRRSLGRRLRAPAIIPRCAARPRSCRSTPAPIGARTPPPAWYTGAGHPADGRRPHARRGHFLHGLAQSSPFAPVDTSATRAGDTHGGPGHGSHAPKCYVIRAACTTRRAVSAQLYGLPSEPF